MLIHILHTTKHTHIPIVVVSTLSIHLFDAIFICIKGKSYLLVESLEDADREWDCLDSNVDWQMVYSSITSSSL